MVFNSASFLFIFLPLSFVFYRLVPGSKGKNILLCIFSLIFYAFGGLAQIPILILAILWDWFFGLWLVRCRFRRKLLCGIAVAGNLLLLCLFKYTSFLFSVFGIASPITWALPLGISFFTFHGISYLVDVYRQPEECERNLLRLSLYLAFFPRLLAGPIVSYRQAKAELDSRSVAVEDVSQGLRRFVKGLCKKLLLSEAIGAIANGVYVLAPDAIGCGLAWLGAVSYCLQLYFDFSGYSDMAIGLGRLFGFHFPENFNYPYVSGTLSEFWRRWHMTLNRWFVDYLYIPLGGSRCSRARAFFNRMLVFFFTGMWHGAGWTFILWGLWHGLFVSLEGLFKVPLERLRKQLIGKSVLHIYTLLVVVIGFAMFRAENVSQGFVLIEKMFSFAPGGFAALSAVEQLLSPMRLVAFGLGILFSLPVVPCLQNKLRLSPNGEEILLDVLALLGLVVCFLALAGGNFSPFIYQQF